MATALVTGASRGLGLALARRLADRGWDLVLDARGAEDLEAAAAALPGGTRVHAVTGDVADEAHRGALVDAVAELGTGLDALVHNASTLGPVPLPAVADVGLDDLRAVYEVNVLGPLRLTQLLLPTLSAGAAVVAVTSDAAVDAYPGWGPYGSSKAALERLLAVLAAERTDLRVHRVDPGEMRTRMLAAALPGQDLSGIPAPEASVPGIVALLEGRAASGRHLAREAAAVAS